MHVSFTFYFNLKQILKGKSDEGIVDGEYL